MGLSKAFYRHYQKIEPGLICNVKDSLVYTRRQPVIQGQGKTAAHHFVLRV